MASMFYGICINKLWKMDIRFGFAMMLTVILTVKNNLNIKIVEMDIHN